MDQQQILHFLKDKPIVAIIPARAGSKRVPHKNVHIFNGKPLIAHTFHVAKQSTLLSRVIVSTDDQEVIALARKEGIDVPFVRPMQYADDFATDKDWITHAVEELNKQGFHPYYVMILRPTSPLRKVEDIDNAIMQVVKSGADSVRSLTKAQHHPYWMKKLEGDFAVPFIDLGKPDEKLRSQDLPPLYRLNGVVDITQVTNLSTDSLYGKKMSYILIEEERALDIDTFDDFAYGEYLVSKQKKEKV
ncbi:acylneuraminate cytidylyltransferase family protein [Candidatus Woesearchaeota archaeon]|nr:acylneuraminate cytidylyltransferase family protein [Candidatus Woesearchaeota archaeon]